MDKRDNQSLLAELTDRFGTGISRHEEPYGLLTIHTSKELILDVLAFLKESAGFTYLTDITAVHYPDGDNTFAIVYHVHNLLENVRVRIKASIPVSDPKIPSATTLWAGANWMERETYDFFGVQFEGHPDLRRILNMDDLDVFPMRREYPLEDPNRVDKRDFYFGR
ncbi:NADH-quinone oxidoreductase subunit C [Sphingobacterium sp. lm-10]|uniref:NADH-quinone oxidoreductase subunit C n=1 Tax=Sphingobacterium sp. lm-10 TaxID=2944904 RepID=UPI002020C153|nr:NADH-quinone oxidoreductase subunit C [Sphingobacterium sp. lm-10]MCL7988344.1 NADH-quinone oxidoreductase subunit C [Sphingobacterium sp. lm-10]